ncbi:LysM peptidoglycan-binding domain-containing protein, partial [Spirochaetes bacterium]|nr:LysM peptidoglycan-binding domain-containing protein [Candidatus Scatousia excrementipullorum]
MSLSVSGVSNGNKAVSKDETIKKKRELRAKGDYVIDKKTTVSELAKKFGMSVDEFKKQTGIKGSTLKPGQIIKNVPTGQIPSGKGLTALAREYGMTLSEFCALNGIDRNYPPQKGEMFYVKFKAENNSSAKSKSSEVNAGEAGLAVPELDAETRAEVSKIKSPEEIAKALYEEADNKAGAVGKDKFNAIFAKLNKDNIN